MIYKFAIIEDDENDYLKLKEYLNRYSKEKNHSFEIDWYKSIDSFFFNNAKIYSLIFMDIMMPGMNGLDGAKELRKRNDNTPLVFVTTMARMACMGYEVDALDFIIKPLEYPSFYLKMERVLRKIKNIDSKRITIKSKNEIITLNENDILYVEVKDHTLIYHTTDKDYSVYGSMRNAVSLLSEKLFYKCNSCYLVNFSKIDCIKGYSVFINGNELLISHPQKSKFIKAFQIYIEGGLNESC